MSVGTAGTRLLRPARRCWIRKGTSKKHGEYYAFRPADGKKAVRSYQLGSGYTQEALEKRLGKKPGVKPDAAAAVPKPKSISGSMPPAGLKEGIWFPVAYQTAAVRTYCKNTVLYRYQNARNYSDIRETEQLAENVRYLLRNNIRSAEELSARSEELNCLLASARAERNRLYRAAPPEAAAAALKEYRLLQENREEAERMGWEDAWEELDDRMEALETAFPLGKLSKWEETRQLALQGLRQEISAAGKELALIGRMKESHAGYSRKKEKEMTEKWQNTPGKK